MSIPFEAMIPKRVPLLARLLRCYDASKGSWRARWGELSFKTGLSLELCLFEEGYSLNIHLIWPCLFLYLKFLPHRQPKEMMESWGFTFCDRALHLNWGDKCKIVWLPWMYTRVRHDVLRPDGKWVPFVGCWERDKEPDGRAIEKHPYRYVLNSGEIQNRIATIYVDESEYRWRGLKWLPWPRKIYRSIEIEFDGEVGERTGTWKGGCIGTSYEMRPNELPEECLRRMERERKF